MNKIENNLEIDALLVQVIILSILLFKVNVRNSLMIVWFVTLVKIKITKFAQENYHLLVGLKKMGLKILIALLVLLVVMLMLFLFN
jgi:hypothetical protein